MQISPRIFKLLEIVFGHELKKLLDLLHFRTGKRRTGLCGLFPFHAVSLKLDEIPRSAGQYLGTAGVHGAIILNANPSPACGVHARFNRTYVSVSQLPLLPLRDAAA